MTRIIHPSVGKVIKGGMPVAAAKRSIDQRKPKVRKDGTPDPACPTCHKKNATSHA